MCLIIHKPANVTITRELADDVFTRNSDGFGILYAEDNTVHMSKLIGSRDDVWNLLNQHQHRELLIHWRMQTHGDIDLENCHPYELFPDADVPSYMMHNGILSTGNAKNTKFSDTWWYIRDYLRPLFDHKSIHTPAAKNMIGSHIGASNKFAIMDSSGQVTIINRKSGVEHQGMWFSNTYAWSPYKFGYYQTYQYNKPSNTMWGDNGSASTAKQLSDITKPSSVVTPSGTVLAPKKPLSKTAKDFDQTVVVADLSQIEIRDLLDIKSELELVASSVVDQVSDVVLLRLMRDIGFNNVCELFDLAFEGQVDTQQFVNLLRNPSIARKELGIDQDKVINPKDVTDAEVEAALDDALNSAFDTYKE